MSFTSIGDLSTGLYLQALNGRLRAQANRLGAELASGRVSDLPGALGGRLGAFSVQSRDLAAIDRYLDNAAELRLIGGTMQDALSALRETAGAVAGELVDAAGGRMEPGLRIAGTAAQEGLGAALSALNARAGGRSLFAGAAFSKAPLPGAPALLAEIEAAVAGLTTADSIEQALADFFGPGGDFETRLYAGAPAPPGPVPVADGESVRFDVTAADPALRDVLRGLAMGAVLRSGQLDGRPEQMADLAERAAVLLLGAVQGVAEIQGRIGAAEARIDQTATRLQARRTALEVDLTRMSAADGYETASALRATENSLEALYLATARLSELTLTRFLR